MKDFLIALAPSLGVLLIFYIGIKALIEADRRERAAAARFERAQSSSTPSAPSGPLDEAVAGAPGSTTPGPDGDAVTAEPDPRG